MDRFNRIFRLHNLLSFPFSNSRELIMDILKHGAEVEVISPPFLLELVKQEIEKMKKNYDNLMN